MSYEFGQRLLFSLELFFQHLNYELNKGAEIHKPSKSTSIVQTHHS